MNPLSDKTTLTTAPQHRMRRLPVSLFRLRRTTTVVSYYGWLSILLWMLLLTVLHNAHGRRIPGLERLKEEKGRPVSIGEFLATQYVKAQQQKLLRQQTTNGAADGNTNTPPPPSSPPAVINKRRFKRIVGSSNNKKTQVITAKPSSDTITETPPTQEESSTHASSPSASSETHSSASESSSPSESVAGVEQDAIAQPPTESCSNPSPRQESSTTTTSSASATSSSASDRTLESWLTPHRELPPIISLAIRNVCHQIYCFVTYRPPVGIVSLWLLVRFCRNAKDLYATWVQKSMDDSDDARTVGRLELQHAHSDRHRRRHRQYISKAWNLDSIDHQYLTSGGVQSVRQRLCMAALSTHAGTSSFNSSSTSSSLLLEALHVTAQPMTSRLDFVYQLLPRLVSLPPPGAEAATRSSSPNANRDNDAVYRVAYWTVLQVRMMDALLRIVRNRLIRSSLRLSRTYQHWKRRVQYLEKRQRRPTFLTSSITATTINPGWWTSLLQSWWLPLWQHPLEADRYQLANARAAYQAELTRLGRIVHILLQQPPDQDVTELLPLAKAIEEEQQATTTHHSWWSALSSPSSIRYSVRWVADGRGHLSVRQLQSPVSSASAGGVLMETNPAVFQALRNDVDATRQAQAWVQQAKRTICQVLEETMQSSIITDHNDTSLLDDLERSWCFSPANDDASKSSPKGNVDDEIRLWNTIIQHCDNLASWRRVGEGRSIRWLDTALVGWSKRIDFLGIPSTFAYYRLAQWVHSKVHPYLPTLRDDAIEILRKVSEIIQQRVWVPFQGIVMDILNQGKGMMSAFSLQDEQLSLDRMLHDLGLGDGTPEQRKFGLQRATEQYEDILQKSLFTHLIRGKLVRLMLIQVQQLKVGLLSALDTIDVLMAGNRVHFYLMATVPALAIAYYSTRFFLRSLYNVRAKDIRPVTFAHADMAKYLDAVETILLTSDTNISPSRPQQPITKGRQSFYVLSPTRVRLDAKELGEVTLMLHQYLLLLDFGSPPFSSSECDHIHEHLRELLFHPGLRVQGDTADLLNHQHLLAWFGTIQRKHRALLQSL